MNITKKEFEKDYKELSIKMMLQKYQISKGHLYYLLNKLGIERNQPSKGLSKIKIVDL